MKSGVTIAVVMLGLAVAGAGNSAWAVTRGKVVRPQTVAAAADALNQTALVTPTNDSYIAEGTTSFSKTQTRVYQFNLKGKWGVKFDVSQPETTPSGFNDIDAGAFYKLTPSVRVGGTVGFGEKSDPLKPDAVNPAMQNSKLRQQPRVHLETTFKF